MTIYKGFGLDESILLSDLIVKPTHSIIHQSYNCHERIDDTGLPPQLNADGFGIGWYVESLFEKKKKKDIKECGGISRKRSYSGALEQRDLQKDTPCVFTSISPAWNNRNLFQLADKVRSPFIFAHVRAASQGSPAAEANCHPFTFDKFLWMHNGGIAQFTKVKRKLLSMLNDVAFNMMQGSTDSEHCFALFLTNLMVLEPIEETNTSVNLKKAMHVTIDQLTNLCRESGITDPSLLNFAVTDGATLVSSRYCDQESNGAPSLYFSSGSKWTESKSFPGQYIMQRHHNVEKVFVMASERLSDTIEDWLEVPKNTIVVVTPSMDVRFYAVPIAQSKSLSN